MPRPALGDFYNQAFNGSVTLPVAGYNYNSGWISFCWRDLHPLEWQLTSLHGQSRHFDRGPAPSGLPDQRTSSDRPGMSGWCQQRIVPVQLHAEEP
jgi:hypothetical protein